MAVVNTCVLLGFRIRCALDGLHLDRVRVTSTGETDLKGLVCLPTPEPGFGSIAVRIEINAPAGEGRLRRLALEALEASPVISTLRCSVNPSMEITVLE